MIGLENVLVAVDFSAASGVALKYAEAFARRFGASLHVLHVLTDPLHETWACYSPGASFLGVVDQLRTEAGERLRQMAPQASAGLPSVECATVWGNATDEILKYADGHRIDVIVCGTHGRRGWDHVTLGSVAERTLRLAHCPVLSVHAPDGRLVTDEISGPSPG